MTTNTAITIYHKVIQNHQEIWLKKVIYEAMWQEKNVVSPETGYVEASEVNIYIPTLENNINNEDVVVKGIQTVSSPDELKDKYYTITNVINCDYGSLYMQHTELVGK